MCGISVHAAVSRSAMRRRSPRTGSVRGTPVAAAVDVRARSSSETRSRSACTTRPSGPTAVHRPPGRCRARGPGPAPPAPRVGREVGAACLALRRTGRSRHGRRVHRADVLLRRLRSAQTAAPAALLPPVPPVPTVPTAVLAGRRSRCRRIGADGEHVAGLAVEAATTPVTGEETSTVALSVSTSASTRVGRDLVADGDEPLDELGLGDTLADVGQLHREHAHCRRAPRASPGRHDRARESRTTRGRAGTACPSRTPGRSALRGGRSTAPARWR